VEPLAGRWQFILSGLDRDARRLWSIQPFLCGSEESILSNHEVQILVTMRAGASKLAAVQAIQPLPPELISVKRARGLQQVDEVRPRPPREAQALARQMLQPRDQISDWTEECVTIALHIIGRYDRRSQAEDHEALPWVPPGGGVDERRQSRKAR